MLTTLDADTDLLDLDQHLFRSAGHFKFDLIHSCVGGYRSDDEDRPAGYSLDHFAMHADIPRAIGSCGQPLEVVVAIDADDDRRIAASVF